jgi:predicted anti-sigma-YlaC factor YlaD
MKCHTVRELLFRRIDNELPGHESADFDAHLSACESCAREYRLLSLPRRIAQGITPIEPSPYFYQKLKANLDGEAQNAAGWQIFLGLARQVIPALAGVTLALLIVFAYFQFTGNELDLYRAYDRVFITEDQPHQMLSEEGEITDEAVLSTIADQHFNYHRSRDMK